MTQTDERRRVVRDRIIAHAWSSACPRSAFSSVIDRVTAWFATNAISLGVVVSTQRTPRTTIGRRVSVLTIDSPTRVVVIGWMSLDQRDLKRVLDRGPSVRVRVMGWLRVAEDIDACLATRALESLPVLVVSRVPPRVRTSLGRAAS